MSTRAYRVNYLDTEDAPTFNLSHRPELYNLLELRPIEGIEETSTEEAEDVIERALRGEVDLTLDELMGLREDITYANEHQDGWLRYDCY